jgi:hypothetical protein
MAFEALGLLPIEGGGAADFVGVTLSPTPPPSRGRGLKGTPLKRLDAMLRKEQGHCSSAALSGSHN